MEKEEEISCCQADGISSTLKKVNSTDPFDSLTIFLCWSSLLVSSLDSIQYMLRADEGKFLLVNLHWYVPV